MACTCVTSEKIHYKENNYSPKESRHNLQRQIQGKKIVVITSLSFGGLGDVVCASKVCQYLHEHLDIALTNIALAVNTKHQSDRTMRWLSELGFTIISDGYDTLCHWNAGLTIIGPVAWQPFVCERIGTDDTPTLVFSEYGLNKPGYEKAFKNIRTYATGLTQEALGILVDPTPCDRTFASKPAKQRLDELSRVSVAWQTAILGTEFSVEARDRFAANSRIYFGYASDERAILDFAEAIVKMNFRLNDSMNLVFCFMGHKVQSFKYWDPKRLQCFEEHGVGTVRYADVNAVERSCERTLSGNKTLTIIVGDLAQREASVMYRLSEYETLATGDQSFSEAISAGKIPVYEVLYHKEAFFHQFFQKLPPLLFERMQRCYSPENGINLFKNLCSEGIAELFVDRIRLPVLDQEMTATAKDIVTTNNFWPRFEESLSQLLADFPAVTTKTVPLEVSLSGTHELRSDQIPFDVPILLSPEDVLKLRVLSDNGISELPQFQDSHFAFNRVSSSQHDYCYLVTRRHGSS